MPGVYKLLNRYGALFLPFLRLSWSDHLHPYTLLTYLRIRGQSFGLFTPLYAAFWPFRKGAKKV